MSRHRNVHEIIYLNVVWFIIDIAASILADQSDEILEIRKEFEMNGKTTELDKFFSPSVSSTPVISRKSLKFDDSNSLVGENNVASRSPQYHHKSRKSSFQRKKVKPDKKSMTDVRLKFIMFMSMM